ncbi:aryl-sulfate sulfotransferase [Sphingobacterium sp. N143]|uniref:aryl-sulfate sulfotransferase n=1 Tax=Sphingobacterium sp. N143 TaxID=2746727 RepID=UPI002575F4A9|nr:aryl-sulfate sulfotransferase [Sphingobacterium sp. N143]MDM1295198.1 aryl-sulfate sulfotransferase [Sphingobacterium sp. N143]
MKSMKPIVALIVIVVAAFAGYHYYANQVEIETIQLTSPNNLPLNADIQVRLNRAEEAYVEYWKEGGTEVQKTTLSTADTQHTFHLLTLEPNSSYKFRVIIDRIVPIKSREQSFKTRPQSPWMLHDWIKPDHPHDEKALGNGLVLLCYRGYPGYMAMVDGKGTIRWYWQDEKLGVRLASLTPRGTILALLAPASKDEFNKPNQPNQKSTNASYYLRSGRIGFVGGTVLVEIDLTGKELTRIDLEKKGIIMHHDVQMDAENNIVGVVRDFRIDDRPNHPKDTLWGDAILTMDTKGNVLKKWSPWEKWDLMKDKKLDSLKHDRFHFNTISFDLDSNYLTSSPIENQVWKIDAKTGDILWKLGKDGDYPLDTDELFYFQHAPHITKRGELLLFDNGDFSPRDSTTANKQSRALAFTLDQKHKTAKLAYSAPLPKKQFTARMGSVYELDNGNLLQTSSKTGCVLVTDKEGRVLWELNAYFIPYRAIYVPEESWSKYRKMN